MPTLATPQPPEHWAVTARRRSFAWGVVAKKRRAQLGREYGLSPAEVQAYLAAPDMAAMTFVWCWFQSAEREGLLGVVRFIQKQLHRTFCGRYGIRLDLGPLLTLIAGLAFFAMAAIARDLLSEITRHRAIGRKGASPLSPFRLKLVHTVAGIVETAIEAWTWHNHPEELDPYVEAFAEIAAMGGDPYILIEPDELPTMAELRGPVPGAVAPSLAGTFVADEDESSLPGWLRFKRRRRPWWPPLPYPSASIRPLWL